MNDASMTRPWPNGKRSPISWFLAIAALTALSIAVPEVSAANAVVNGDFSSNAAAFTTFPGYLGGSNPGAIDNWTASGNNVGINGVGISTPFGPTDQSAATYYAFIQGTGSLSQSITLDANETYAISFLAASRASNPTAQGRVVVADNSTNYYDSGTNIWGTAAFVSSNATFTVPASVDGSITITLSNDTAGDNTVVYSDIWIGLEEPGTGGFSFFVDASQDTDGDSYWEDLTPWNPTGFDLLLDDSPAVTRVPVTGSSTLFTHAYNFIGGSTNNEAGALPVDRGTFDMRSFKESDDGDWSTQPVTLEIWLKPDDLTPSAVNGQIIFEDGGGGGLGILIDDNELVATHDGGENQIRYNIATDSSNVLAAAATSEFIQIVVTHDTASPFQTVLYINGQQVGTSNDDSVWSGGDAAGFGTRGDANVGGLGGGQMDSESFDGQMALIRAYKNQILTPAEVLVNYLAYVPPSSGVTFSERSTTNINTTSAWPSATVNTNLDTCVLVWDTTDQGAGSTNDWPSANRLSLGAQSAGAITDQITGLAADTGYTWRLYGTNATMYGWSAPVTFETVLSADQNPVFTNATALSAFAIQLGWEDNATTETAYLLYRSSGGSYQALATLPANTTSYQDDTVAASTTYTYRLAATNDTNGSVTDFTACQSSSVTTPAISWAQATGGTVTNYTDTNGVSWVAHAFTSSGTLEITSDGVVEYLIVAGGGGGGGSKSSKGAGGGGAGGLLQGFANVVTGTSNVVVGAGGNGGSQSNIRGVDGINSSAFGLVADGGGGAGSTITVFNGNDGGSGGGGARLNSGTGGSGTSGQGNDGGNPVADHIGGGGGGALGAGGSPDGGAGVSSNISGISVVYAAGGTGGSASTAGAGANGAANTGQGGGGAYVTTLSDASGGNGGSGIVLVRYQIPAVGTIFRFR